MSYDAAYSLAVEIAYLRSRRSGARFVPYGCPHRQTCDFDNGGVGQAFARLPQRLLREGERSTRRRGLPPLTPINSASRREDMRPGGNHRLDGSSVGRPFGRHLRADNYTIDREICQYHHPPKVFFKNHYTFEKNFWWYIYENTGPWKRPVTEGELVPVRAPTVRAVGTVARA